MLEEEQLNLKILKNLTKIELNPSIADQMSDKFKNKYRIESSRLRYWDYGWNGPYFVTICTQYRECFFGNVVDGEMELSEMGKFANDCWCEIPEHFPFVELDAFVVMPNHVHGIIIIDKPDDTRNNAINPVTSDDVLIVETQNFASLQPAPQSPQSPKNKYGPQSQNLASIIRGYKIGVTKQARMLNPGFGWQPRYHDHIIRDEKSFDRIKQYIISNPALWQDDVYHK